MADSSKEAGLMILDILFTPGKKRGDICTVFQSVAVVIIAVTLINIKEKRSCPQLITLVGDIHQSLCRAQQQGPDLLLLQGASSSLQHFSQSHKCAAHPALIPSMRLRMSSTGSTITCTQLHTFSHDHSKKLFSHRTQIRLGSWVTLLLIASAFITGLRLTWRQFWVHQRICVRAQLCLFNVHRRQPLASQSTEVMLYTERQYSEHYSFKFLIKLASITHNNVFCIFDMYLLSFHLFKKGAIIKIVQYKQGNPTAFVVSTPWSFYLLSYKSLNLDHDQLNQTKLPPNDIMISIWDLNLLIAFLRCVLVLFDPMM